MVFRIQSTHVQLMVSLSGHKLLYGISFLSSSLSVISLVLSSSLDTLFSLLARNLRLYLPHIAMHFYDCAHVWGQEVKGQGERKSIRGSPILLGLKLL